MMFMYMYDVHVHVCGGFALTRHGTKLSIPWLSVHCICSLVFRYSCAVCLFR